MNAVQIDGYRYAERTLKFLPQFTIYLSHRLNKMLGLLCCGRGVGVHMKILNQK